MSSATATKVHPKASRSAGDSHAPGLGGGSLLGIRVAWASAGPTPLGRDPSSIQCLIGCDPRFGVRFRRKTEQSLSGAVRPDNLDVEAALRGLRDNCVRCHKDNMPTHGLIRQRAA